LPENLARKIDHLLHAEGCLQGWLLVEQFSTDAAQGKEARAQAEKFRDLAKSIRKQITNHINRSK
jgi:hypothetical protein